MVVRMIKTTSQASYLLDSWSRDLVASLGAPTMIAMSLACATGSAVGRMAILAEMGIGSTLTKSLLSILEQDERSLSARKVVSLDANIGLRADCLDLVIWL